MRAYNATGVVKDPSHALLVAVVVQAVDDLDSSDPTAKFEANRFFRDQEGGWADMRRFYFDALGVNEAKALASLTPRFSNVEPPEPPGPKKDDVLAILPRVPFTARQIADVLGVRHNKTASHFQVLMNEGKIRRISRGVFVKSDYAEPPALPPAPSPVKPAYADVRQIVHSHLRERPQKFTELIQSTNGDVSDSVIRTVLRNGLLTGELVRSWDARYSHRTPHTFIEPDPVETASFEHT